MDPCPTPARELPAPRHAASKRSDSSVVLAICRSRDREAMSLMEHHEDAEAQDSKFRAEGVAVVIWLRRERGKMSSSLG